MSLIQVMLGGHTEYDFGVPRNVGGTPGFMDTSDLQLKEHYIDNDVETTSVVEYWEDEVLRHRSVNMVLKRPATFESDQGKIG